MFHFMIDYTLKGENLSFKAMTGYNTEGNWQIY